ncbi:MAG: alpha/beta fold hydrolase, partial [Bacteroidota bacterium]
MKLEQKIAVAFLRKKFKLLVAFSREKAAKKAVQLFCTPRIKIRKELSPLFKKAEQLHFDLNGTLVHGYRWNHPANHKALILHGFDSSAVNFEQYVQPLLKKGYEVLAFDAPAHGKSGGTIITVPAYRDMILYIYEHYGPIQSFMAHSMGGLALALAMEKIKHDNKTRVALIAPATESVTAFDNFFQFLQIKDKEVRILFDKQIEDMTGLPVSWFSITRAMHQIEANLLWVHDEDDKITP